MSKMKTVAKRSSAQAMLSAFGRRRTWREWAKLSDAGSRVAKKRKTKKTKIKRKRTAKKSKPEKRYDPNVDVLEPDVSDEALERERALSFTRYGCP